VRIYTKGGDDGTTGLLYGGRVDKSDLRTEAYGTTDEAVAALGMARVFIADSILADLVLHLQRELFVVGAELATAAENAHKLTPGTTKVTAAMVEELERHID
jgi:cob(I)alamin adenosyltransferase